MLRPENAIDVWILPAAIPPRRTSMTPFENWTPLKSVSVGQFPDGGRCAIVYALRDGRDGEILKFGKTGCARDRIFKNYIGGNGGSTTRRIYDNLFTDGFIEHVEIAWICTTDAAEAERSEKHFRRKRGDFPSGERAILRISTSA
jgi:hypothetical protein